MFDRLFSKAGHHYTEPSSGPSCPNRKTTRSELSSEGALAGKHLPLMTSHYGHHSPWTSPLVGEFDGRKILLTSYSCSRIVVKDMRVFCLSKTQYFVLFFLKKKSSFRLKDQLNNSYYKLCILELSTDILNRRIRTFEFRAFYFGSLAHPLNELPARSLQG